MSSPRMACFARLDVRGGSLWFAAVVFENRVADSDALVADVGPSVIAGAGNQLHRLILRLPAEGAAQDIRISSASPSHALYPPPTNHTISTRAPSPIAVDSLDRVRPQPENQGQER